MPGVVTRNPAMRKERGERPRSVPAPWDPQDPRDPRDPRDADIPPPCLRSRRIPQRSRVSQEVVEADAALRGVRLEVGRLVPQQQSRHDCSSQCNSRRNSRRAQLPVVLPEPPPPPLRLRSLAAPPPLRARDRRARDGAEAAAAVMATYVSELEAAKKSLSEALGENVKQ